MELGMWWTNPLGGLMQTNQEVLAEIALECAAELLDKTKPDFYATVIMRYLARAAHLQPEAPADGYYKVVAGVMTKLSGADAGVLFNAEGPISPTNDKFNPTSGDRG